MNTEQIARRDAHRIISEHPDRVPQGIIDHWKRMRDMTWERRLFGLYARYRLIVKYLMGDED